MTTAPSRSPHKELLQTAVKAWALGELYAPGWKNKEALEEQVTSAKTLLDSGLLSVRNVARIARLAPERLAELGDPSIARLGGRVAPSTLPLVLDLLNTELARTAAAVSMTSVDLTKRIVAGGTSVRTIERLTGIPESTLRRWAEWRA